MSSSGNLVLSVPRSRTAAEVAESRAEMVWNKTDCTYLSNEQVSQHVGKQARKRSYRTEHTPDLAREKHEGHHIRSFDTRDPPPLMQTHPQIFSRAVASVKSRQVQRTSAKVTRKGTMSSSRRSPDDIDALSPGSRSIY